MKISNSAVNLATASMAFVSMASASEDVAMQGVMSKIVALSEKVEALSSEVASLKKAKSKSPAAFHRHLRGEVEGGRLIAALGEFFDSDSAPDEGRPAGTNPIIALFWCFKNPTIFAAQCEIAKAAFASIGIGGGGTDICYRAENTDLTVRIAPELDGGSGRFFTEIETFNGYFNFTTVTVGSNQDVLIDVTASTGNLMFTGNDYDFSADFADTVGGNGDYVEGANWNSVNGVAVSLGIELTPSVGGEVIPAVPQSMVTLRSVQEVFALDQDDWAHEDDAFLFQNNNIVTNTGKFLFPNLAAGDYDIKVLVHLNTQAELQRETDDADYTVQSKVVLGPHSIIATVLDSDDNQCSAITEVVSR